jgi:asparagine synthase (glutamine-hydrolysing)
MCGVVAVSSSREPVDVQGVSRALDAIAHRGPDGRGVWLSPDRRAALGHVRLAVRDLERGAQPIASEDGRVVAAVNGELYATESLRAELVGRGHRMRSRTDSELVVHAWEEWRSAMLPRLRGEFAFVLWDERERVLFAARDRFGVKPLAWAEHAGRVLVASQVRGLFALGLPVAWDRAALFRCGELQYPGPSATLFAGARELPPGHHLTVRGGTVAVREYWDIPASAPCAALDEPGAARELAARIDDAVRARLEADVPCAFQLSGGIDSSAVLASAARAGARPLDAFTVSFVDGGAYDEADLAARTAESLGATLHTVRVSDRDIADGFADAVVHSEGACINAHAAAKLRLSAALRDAGYKVVLTGEGADEVLFGYAHLRSDVDDSVARWLRTNAASAGLMLPDGDGIPTAAVRQALGFVPTWIAAKAAFGKRVRTVARAEWLSAWEGRDAARDLVGGFDLARLRGRERVEQSAYLWTKLALEGYILRGLGDGLEMAHGVEGRLPYLDSTLFEFVAALPLRAKIRDGVEKWVLREAMRDRLPPAITSREKHPFLAPPMGPCTREVARDVFASASARAQPLFDPQRVLVLIDQLEDAPTEQRKALDPVVYFLLSIAILQARLGVAS